MFKKLVLSLTALAVVSGCGEQAKTETLVEASVSVAELAKQLIVKHEIVTNRVSEECDPKQTEGLCYQAKLSLTTPNDFNGTKWQLFFSNMSPIQLDKSDEFDVTHINGDLHSLVPTAQFKGFEAGKTLVVPVQAGFWTLSETDRMPNYYLVDSDGKSHIVQSTVEQIDPETGLSKLPHAVPLTLEDQHFKRTPNDSTAPATANWLFEENARFYQQVDVSNKILPTPASISVLQEGRLSLTQGIQIKVDSEWRSGIEAALERLNKFGVDTSESGVVVQINEASNLPSEGYRLRISQGRIDLDAQSAAGAFYGIQSIASLLDSDKTLPYALIEDAPRFEFRGMHIDVSRNFKSKTFIKQVLDEMAAYKLNKFHFHLADDEGWRVEIPDLPELTEIGAFRCHDVDEDNCLIPQLGSGPNRDSVGNGYYSVSDYKEILRYATARHIQVIPSMDMPGHSRAAIKSMAARYKKLKAAGKVTEAKQYLLHDIEDSTVYSSIQFYNDNTINACMDSSYDFIGKVIDELTIIHAAAGNTLTRYHIGADETAGAWIKSAACKELLENNVLGIETAEDISAYFVEKVSRLLAAKGIEAAGWNDGMGHTKQERMPAKVQSNGWSPLMWDGHQAAHEQANRGWDLVVSSPDALYFDFPYEADQHERGYYWAARRINTRKVFSMMPENLPAHAEYWLDREENPYTADDRLQKDETGKVTHQPLKSGIKFHGMQGQLWTETVRTDRQASYMVFPRLYALAERAWYKAPWELEYDYNGRLYGPDTGFFTADKRAQMDQDWINFANSLASKVLPRAEQLGVFYRLPTPGAKVENGKLFVNSIYPGLAIEYRVDGGQWQKIDQAVAVTGKVEVRTVSPSGARASRILSL